MLVVLLLFKIMNKRIKNYRTTKVFRQEVMGAGGFFQRDDKRASGHDAARNKRLVNVKQGRKQGGSPEVNSHAFHFRLPSLQTPSGSGVRVGVGAALPVVTPSGSNGGEGLRWSSRGNTASPNVLLLHSKDLPEQPLHRTPAYK